MMILFVISILLSIFYFGFIFFIYLGLKKLSGMTIHESESRSYPSVTLLIPFRNEEVNLVRAINCVNNLVYPQDKLEVFFINDNSTDNSLEIFNNAHKKSFINLLNLDENESSKARKKRAILYGIENSRNEIIITTDADCFFTDKWILETIHYFDDQTALVAGPVDLVVNDSWFGGFQRIEFAGLNLAAAGLISIGKPIICSAANLAYKRSVFEEVGGFGDTIKYSSGDDDFLLQKIASLRKYKIRFSYSLENKVYTEGKDTINGFVNQRARWASKGFGYEKISTVLLLVLIFLFYLFIPFQLIMIVFGNSIFMVALIFAIALKIYSEFLVMKKGLTDLYDKSLLKFFLLAEFLQIPYIILSPLIGIFGKFSWKGRSLKK